MPLFGADQLFVLRALARTQSRTICSLPCYRSVPGIWRRSCQTGVLTFGDGEWCGRLYVQVVELVQSARGGQPEAAEGAGRLSWSHAG